ncbi:alpha/beta-hydrolase [Punctularia strigosozonata HHB-11173 SS5]|uniref:Alpha/beta-hydrolase n=1 Tax=Punctularia strigosozonata (strain HHB-11173) TaxID=741275 RepID=R7S1N2_PUNST|nr:alpha/beta-hydrolase [Punctularia strigosozonata HHB-11173 SS5]EIN04290.1 alpha/beta-hydrolase [Punctularia strigosozonata HHB-11173 SS5]
MLGLACLGEARFDPRGHAKEVAKCPSVNRAEGRDVEIDIHYVDLNPKAKRTLLMVHGWPGLWSTWSYQIEAFQEEYRVLAVDQRGFGSSTHPDDVKSSGNMVDLVGDLACVLEHANVDKAICVGHDWGSAVCYEAARRRPDIIEGVVGIAVPYLPATGPFIPTSTLAHSIPTLNYQLYFAGDTAAAVAELDADVRRTLRSTHRTIDSPSADAFLTSRTDFLGAYANLNEIPPIPYMTPDEEDYLVEQYSIQGFKNTVQFYQDANRYATWQGAHEQGNFTIPQPVLAILPTKDRVADWVLFSERLGVAKWIPSLTQKTVESSHWPHLERPDDVNGILREWLGGLGGPSESTRHLDEL